MNRQFDVTERRRVRLAVAGLLEVRDALRHLRPLHRRRIGRRRRRRREGRQEEGAEVSVQKSSAGGKAEGRRRRPRSELRNGGRRRGDVVR